MATAISIGSSPGFKFSPTEEELILYYLKKKIEGFEKSVEVIPELDITQHEPWDLPAKSIIKSDNEWFFFYARGRKYSRGLQSRRATERGYWKATGKERNVKSNSNIIGTKRTLVFHKGRAPKGQRTEWIMHEYCMSGTSQDSLVVCRLRRNCGSSTGESSSSALANDGLQPKGMLEGAPHDDGHYNDGNRSENTHSVDHIDSDCESHHKLEDGILQAGSCSRKKGCDSEDDCFADILNDDIVKLDDIKLKEPVQGALPLQGTANLRIRLLRQKEKSYLIYPVEASKVGDEKFSVVHII